MRPADHRRISCAPARGSRALLRDRRGSAGADEGMPIATIARSMGPRAWIVVAVAVLPAVAVAEDRPGGPLSAQGGFVVQTGRSLVVDNVSGASTKANVDTFTQ